MTYFRWGIRFVMLVLLFALLHYNLPQRDIVYVSGVDIKRQDLGPNPWFWASVDTGSAETGNNRDVRFIDTVQYNNDQVMVYRNEDTGLGWPPYFKFDSADVHAEARNLQSTRDNPQLVVITHYGWRNVWFSIYPNVISIRPIDNPTARLIPWFNIAFIILLLALGWTIRTRWVRFRRRHIEPTADEVGDVIAEQSSRVRRFFNRKKP